MRPISTRQRPTFAEEKALHARGYLLIAGVDEVGRGALMGPVVAAAVILPVNLRASWRREIRDSKQLRPAARERLSSYIQEKAVASAVGMASHDVVDSLGIAKATRLAMKSAVEKLFPEPQYLLIDYIRLVEVPIPQQGITYGDSLCFSIACASIIAKVYRDRLVAEMDAAYPGYQFARHKGYGTREHLASLRRQGPCPVHRRSFLPVKELVIPQR